MTFEEQIELARRCEEACWEDTTFTPEKWSNEFADFTTGSCGVIACYIKETYGGEIYECEAQYEFPSRGLLEEPVAHYFNVVDGALIDPSRRQFECGTVYKNIRPTTVEKILSNDWFTERYFNFLKRMNEI